MTAYTDMTRISNPPTCTMDAIDAVVASRISFTPLNILTVLINLKSFTVTRETRATLMTDAFRLSDTAEAMETTTTIRSMTLLGSLKYLLARYVDRQCYYYRSDRHGMCYQNGRKPKIFSAASAANSAVKTFDAISIKREKPELCPS